MKYQIVTGGFSYNRRKGLEENVNRLIEQGWEPIGGIAVSSYREDSEGNRLVEHFYQAMVKKD